MSLVKTTPILLMFSSSCLIEFAPTILLFTKGLLFTNALASVLGVKWYFFARFTYLIIAESPRAVFRPETLFGHKLFFSRHAIKAIHIARIEKRDSKFMN